MFAGKDNTTQLGPRKDFYGQAVVIRLDRRYVDKHVYVLYGHIKTWKVHKGDRVKKGQDIATVGAEGIALGPHLHLEVRLGKNTYTATVNPEFWLVPLPKHGTLIGRLTTPDGYAWLGARINVYRVKEKKPVYWTTIPTYLPEPGIQPDPLWGENWLLTDVPEGKYILEFSVPGGQSRREVTVKAGQTTWVDVTLPPK